MWFDRLTMNGLRLTTNGYANKQVESVRPELVEGRSHYKKVS
jgi:hypothetical protein